MKRYNVYIAGSTKIDTVQATCITKACKRFIETLEKAARYELDSREQARIRYTDNYSICSNFVIIEQ